MIRTAIYGPSGECCLLAENLRESSGGILTGIFSPSAGNDFTTLSDHPGQPFYSFTQLCDAADAIIFTGGCSKPFPEISRALKRSRHVFITPSMNLSHEEIAEVWKLAEEAGVLLYLGHNPVSHKLKNILAEYCPHPEYIDSYSYVDYSVNPKDNYVRETLYHEIIFVLSLSHATCRRYSTKTVPYWSSQPMLLNARMEFTNGASANLTINNCLPERSRFTEIYGETSMIRLDSRNKTVGISSRNQKIFKAVKLEEDDGQILKEEIDFFLNLINNKNFPVEPSVSGILAHQTTIEMLNSFLRQKACQ